MKIKALSLSTFLGFLGILFIIHTMKAHGSTTKISCSTPFEAKKFIIEENQITFQKEDSGGVNRSISSTNNGSIRTHHFTSGFTKILYFEGNKYSIKIGNVNEFSEIEDSLSITGPKGHVVTYPLNCQII